MSYREEWGDSATAQWTRLAAPDQKAVASAVFDFVRHGRGAVTRLGGPRLRLRIRGFDVLLREDPVDGIIYVVGIFERP